MKKNLLLIALLGAPLFVLAGLGDKEKNEDLGESLDMTSFEQDVNDSWRMDKGGEEDLRAKILDSQVLSENEEDCFSEAEDDAPSRKGKEKVKSLIPSIKGLQKAGYHFFITGIRNVSDASDLEVRRARSKKCEASRATQNVIKKGDYFSINTRAPKVSQDHLVILDNGDIKDPLWKIYQGLHREDENDTQGEICLLIKKRGENAVRLLSATTLPQIIALKVRTSKIEVDLPGNVENMRQPESMFKQFTASLPALPHIPSLFDDEGSSSGSTAVKPLSIQQDHE